MHYAISKKLSVPGAHKHTQGCSNLGTVCDAKDSWSVNEWIKPVEEVTMTEGSRLFIRWLLRSAVAEISDMES